MDLTSIATPPRPFLLFSFSFSSFSSLSDLTPSVRCRTSTRSHFIRHFSFVKESCSHLQKPNCQKSFLWRTAICTKVCKKTSKCFSLEKTKDSLWKHNHAGTKRFHQVTPSFLHTTKIQEALPNTSEDISDRILEDMSNRIQKI